MFATRLSYGSQIAVLEDNKRTRDSPEIQEATPTTQSGTQQRTYLPGSAAKERLLREVAYKKGRQATAVSKLPALPGTQYLRKVKPEIKQKAIDYQIAEDKFVAVKLFNRFESALLEQKIVKQLQDNEHISPLRETAKLPDRGYIFTDIAAYGDGIAVQNRIKQMPEGLRKKSQNARWQDSIRRKIRPRRMPTSFRSELLYTRSTLEKEKPRWRTTQIGREAIRLTWWEIPWKKSQ